MDHYSKTMIWEDHVLMPHERDGIGSQQATLLRAPEAHAGVGSAADCEVAKIRLECVVKTIHLPSGSPIQQHAIGRETVRLGANREWYDRDGARIAKPLRTTTGCDSRTSLHPSVYPS